MGDCVYLLASKADLEPARENVVNRLDALGAPKYPSANDRRVKRLQSVLEQVVERQRKDAAET